LTLAATVAEPLAARQPGLDGRRDDGEDLARLVDRLSARFGPRALVRPAMREGHIPERTETWAPALGPSPGPVPPPLRPRPLRLFDPPEEVRVVYAVPEGPPAQFVWRRVTHRVTRFAGPERIAPEWWRDKPGTRLRDYFRVEDHEGRRFWLYREGLPDDGRGGAPRWFMQGAFG
jgi:protein ImuB